MNVEIERPKLLAARRLGAAVQQREASLAVAATPPTKKAGGDYGTGAANILEAPLEDDGRMEEQNLGIFSPNTGQVNRVHLGLGIIL